MKTLSMKSVVACAMLGLGLVEPVSAHSREAAGEEIQDKKESKVQLALLLDTSSSMDGLIQQAKTQLWSIVNTFGHAQKDGRNAFVEVALYEYGNNALEEESYWIRQVLPFTRDLDEVSEQLFSLKTNGGNEYCGAVIRRAIEQLEWDDTPGTYRAMFVAGNEPFNQGPIDPGAACREAMAKSVVVNSIHCGDESTGVNSGWKSGALVTGGTFCVIDQNKAVVQIDCPQDKIIIELNGKLNKTYLRFGSMGLECQTKQWAQDGNAQVSKEAAVSRAMTKATFNYDNRSWDLVDACRTKDFDWSKVEEEHLPEELKGLTLAERKAHVAKMTAEREAIQKRIQELNKERAAFLAAERKKQGEEAAGTLGDEVRRAVASQAKALGYQLGQ
ncbi:vWA domain-containing protein [Roseibacillus persicicus]|uniref:vWA domain-containing protein n=1 Tax=Roseibacillus persicicus TaxID=454148 RepID=UPI00398B8AD5